MKRFLKALDKAWDALVAYLRIVIPVILAAVAFFIFKDTLVTKWHEYVPSVPWAAWFPIIVLLAGYVVIHLLILSKIVLELNPLQFSVLGGAAVFGLFYELWLLVEYNRTGLAHLKAFEVALTLIAIAAWVLTWQPEDEENKDDKKADTLVKKGDNEVSSNAPRPKKVRNKIPDGHIGILEFLGMPIRWLIITEGKLWLPVWIMSVKALDMRPIEFQIPATAEELGFVQPSKNNVPMLIRLSVPASINRDKLFEALFEIGPDAAWDGLRNIMVGATRLFIPQYDDDKLVDNKPVDIVDPDPPAGTAPTTLNIGTQEALVKVLAAEIKKHADGLFLSVNIPRLRIPKLTWQPRVQEAKEEQVIQQQKNLAAKERNKAVMAMAKDLQKKNHGWTREEAILQARLNLGQSIHEQIEVTGGAAVIVQTKGKSTP